MTQTIADTWKHNRRNSYMKHSRDTQIKPFQIKHLESDSDESDQEQEEDIDMGQGNSQDDASDMSCE